MLASSRDLRRVQEGAWVGEARTPFKGSGLGFPQGPSQLATPEGRGALMQGPHGGGVGVCSLPHPRQLKLPGGWWEGVGLPLVGEPPCQGF